MIRVLAVLALLDCARPPQRPAVCPRACPEDAFLASNAGCCTDARGSTWSPCAWNAHVRDDYPTHAQIVIIPCDSRKDAR